MSLTSSSIHHISPAASRKKSKHDQFQIGEEQQKINDMIHAFYDKLKSKINKSLTKYQNKNAILCKELFQSLNLHPKQELYQTIKLHDIIFNEIQHLTQIAYDFIKKIDTLQQKLTVQFITQKQKNLIKKEKEKQGQNTIAILRKVSFKREKHSLNNRSIALDTINKKILKCEEANNENGFYFDIEGKKSDILIYSYQKIWFQNKKRDYLLCYGKDKNKSQFYIFNDKLQTISTFSDSFISMNNHKKILQINNLIYIVTDHEIVRTDLLCQQNKIRKIFNQTIIGGETFNNQIVLWVYDGEGHHTILFLDQEINIYDKIDLKLNVSAIVNYFKLVVDKEEIICFITRSHSGFDQLFRVTNNELVSVLCDLVNIEQVIYTGTQRTQQEAIFRMNNNKFVVFNGKKFTNLQVDIDQCENIKNCVILGQHLYALSENGKYMLECHYQSKLV